MSAEGVAPFVPNRRGNALAAYRIELRGAGHVLRLRGPDEVVRHLRALPPDLPRYRLGYLEPHERAEWSHLLEADSPPDPRVRTCLDLLRVVLSVPCSGLTTTVVLDWYKEPEEDIDPRLWNNTTAGELVSQAKYRYRNSAARQAEIGRVLAGAMVTVIEGLPHYAAADVILGVPGHDTSRLSFGARIAPTLREALDLRYVPVLQRDSYRPEMKSLGSAEHAVALEDQFSLLADLTGSVVIVADDVLRTGSSLQAVARAAREAGAVRTLGLAAVRTMRG